VAVVAHSYRHRFGLVDGDPAYAATERAIAAQPRITVPTVVLDPTDDTLHAPQPRSEHERHFTQPGRAAHGRRRAQRAAGATR
jgi:hypothetical protein